MMTLAWPQRQLVSRRGSSRFPRRIRAARKGCGMSGYAGAERARAVTIRDLLDMQRRGEKIVALTAYDYLFARLVDEAGGDVALVGDSLAQVVLGLPSTLP